MCSPRIADCCASTKCGKREVTVIPSVSPNRSYIGRDRAFSRVFAEYLLGFEGTQCVILSGVLKQHQTIKFACRCRYAEVTGCLSVLPSASAAPLIALGASSYLPSA